MLWALCMHVVAVQPRSSAPGSLLAPPSHSLSLSDLTCPAPGTHHTYAMHPGYTENYQAKRIENTSLRDEPFEFVLGAKQVTMTAFRQPGWHAGG